MRPEQLHQKLGLVQQLKTLARQHEQVLQAYERKVQEKLQEGALAATSGGKRAGPPLGADGPEAKRHRQLAERASRKNELWNEVVKIVEKIRKNAKSEAFRQPVDPIKLKIPDYLNVITKPMDLGTVLKKLRSKPMGYTQPQEVADDVRQIWINCRTYNGENHPITLAANTCSEAFEKAWGQANIEQRWEVEMMREQREEQAFAGGEAEAGDDTIVNQLRYKRNMLGDLIAAKDVQDNLPPGSLGDLAPDRDMTFEEKRKLSAHMASLPGEKLVAVLDIISEGENIQHDGEGEVEVDIDALHNNTLWKLKAYVDGVLTATSGPPPKKTANRGPAPNKQGPPAAAAGGGGMPPPPPPGAAAAVGGQPGLAPPAAPQQQQPQQQQPLQPPQQPPGAGAMLPPPQQQPPQSQPPQPMQPPPKQPPQQAPGSPQHSGGVSAQEVVGSTAGGPGAARSHQFTYDMGTVAQSGTNARPSNFVMGKARQPTPTADAAGTAAAGEQPAQAGPTHMDAGTAEQWEAALKDGTTAGDAAAAPAAAAAAGAADAAAGTTPAGEAAAAPAAAPDDAKPAPPAPAAAAAAAAGGAAAADAAPAAADAKPVGDAAAAAGPAAAAADAPAAPPAEAPAALEAAAAAPTAAAAEASGTAPAAPAAAPAEEPAAVAGAPAAGDGSGAPEESSEWEKFQEIAKQQEDEIAKKKEEEQRRKEEAEEQKRLKAEQEQQKQQQEKDARAAEIFRSMGGAGGGAAAANDAAVHADVEKLLKATPPPPAAGAAAAAGDGPAAMDVDSDSEKQQQEEDDEEDDGLPADGGGFD